MAEAARFTGIPEQSLRNACSGEHEPRSPLLLALSEKFGVSLDYLLGLSDEPEPPATMKGGRDVVDVVERVKRLDICAAAGAGAVNHMFATEETLAFPKWMLRRLAAAGARLSFLRGQGDSMEPTIGDGALLLVSEDEADRLLPDRPPKPRSSWDQTDIYVFLLDGELRVKRLRRAGRGSIVVSSDNSAYGPEVLLKADLKRLEICGRVIWWDNRL
nr:S24 family peptidase [Methylosinus sp. Sm6]